MAKASGASISLVYTALKDLVNKDQQGFISEAVFNNFAQVAQLQLFNDLFSGLKDAKRNSRAGFELGRDKSLIKRLEEDLSYFSASKTLDAQSDTLVFERPEDLSRIISLTTFGSIVLDQSTKRPIELCYDEEKIDRILISNISAPTEEFPIALVSEDFYVFPTSIKKIQIRYYKYPASRNHDGSRNSLPPLVSGSSIRDFELPEHYTSDLIYTIGKLIGLNLRDTDVINYTGQELANNKQEQTY